MSVQGGRGLSQMLRAMAVSEAMQGTATHACTHEVNDGRAFHQKPRLLLLMQKEKADAKPPIRWTLAAYHC